MALRLRVVSEHATRLGEQSTKVFGVHGGTIGRSTNNEWILPDPERYLSGKHIRIDFRAGNYILVDTSSNGTYVNGAQVPLGKYHDYQLREGDYVRLGEYELLVSIDKSNDFPPDDSSMVAYDGQSPSSAVKKSTANDLGADLDLSQLLEPSDLSQNDSGVRPRDAYGQAVQSALSRSDASLHLQRDAETEAGGTPWHMMTRPLKVEGRSAESLRAESGAAPAARPPSPVLFDGDFDVGLSAFCRGAGIEPRNISTEARGAALQLAGQLLREAVLGLMDLNQSRNEFRNRFRISPPPNDGPESPLNFSKGVDEALVRLLTTLSTRAGSVEAIRHNFRELKAQNVASITATRAAFEEFLGRVNPAELEERFDRATKRGVFGSQNKAKYWELYAEMFAGLAQRPADGFPHVFTETFAKAYEAKVRALVPPRRTSFGADRAEGTDPDSQAVGEP
ncbi:MAG TPA: type VI secretion system-associated FHA domain protein TagH [Steroidobacteraceae bacterium]|jgi:type VI secretion system protein|nr:type VI secretion system-associated FHA domain protein TagH [Steroidobacteraceae bacterium]